MIANDEVNGGYQNAKEHFQTSQKGVQRDPQSPSLSLK